MFTQMPGMLENLQQGVKNYGTTPPRVKASEVIKEQIIRIRALEAKIYDLDDELSELREINTQLRNKITIDSDAKLLLEQNNKKTQNDLLITNTELNRIKEEIRKNENAIHQAQTNNTTSNKHKQAAQKISNNRDIENERLEEENEKLRQQVSQLTLQTASNSSNKITYGKENYENQAKIIRSSNDSSDFDYIKTQMQNTYERRIATHDKQIISLKETQESLEKQIKSLNNDISKQHRINKELKETIRSQDDEIRSLNDDLNSENSEKKKLQQNLYSTQMQAKILGNDVDLLKQQNTKLIEINSSNIIETNTLKKIASLKQLFNSFINVYVEENQNYQNSYGCFGLFSQHGLTGRNAAYELAFKFNNAFPQDLDTPTAIIDFIKDLKTKNEHLFTGNYNAGSFKTYLLAYCNFLSTVDINKEIPKVDILNCVNQYVRDNKNIKLQYETFLKRDVPKLNGVRNTAISI